MFWRKSLYLNQDLRASVTNPDFQEFEDYLKFSGKELVPRLSQSLVWALYFQVEGKKIQYVCQQPSTLSPKHLFQVIPNRKFSVLDVKSQGLLLELFCEPGILVMKDVGEGKLPTPVAGIF